jgi:hypothetical protein
MSVRRGTGWLPPVEAISVDLPDAGLAEILGEIHPDHQDVLVLRVDGHVYVAHGEILLYACYTSKVKWGLDVVRVAIPRRAGRGRRIVRGLRLRLAVGTVLLALVLYFLLIVVLGVPPVLLTLLVGIASKHGSLLQVR